jgi:hypothetical protein
MTRCLTIKILLFCRLLPVHIFALFMVISASYGEQRPVYGDVYTVVEYDEGIYYPTWVAA